MGSLYRSEEMSLVNIYLQSEAAFTCVSELGEVGLIQFTDLNESVNSFQRKFVSEVRRCDEMERKLRFMEKEMKKDNIMEDYHKNVNPLAPGVKEMNELEAKLEKFETDMKEVNKNQEKLKKNYLELTELKHILRKAQVFFEETAHLNDQRNPQELDEDHQSLLGNEYSSVHTINTLSFVAGVIQIEKMANFEKVLWRSCRGNVFLRFAEIDATFSDPETGDAMKKNVFVIFFQGDQLKQRVKSICEGFHATLYPCPETSQERREIAIGVMTRIEDLQTVLNRTEEHRRMILTQIAADIRKWFIMVGKMKAIYHTLNKFNVNMADKCLIGEGWCAVKHIDEIRYTLRRATEMSGSSVPSILQELKTKETPPTFHQTNNFTQSFQTIIDAYGIASYREINPTPFTIVTFPFLFAVMFGDVGHGLLMFLFALVLVWREKEYLQEKGSNEIWQMVFGGRYLILMMGFFSMYTGFLYNECFAISLNVFGTAWNVSNIRDVDKILPYEKEIELDPWHNGEVYRSVGVYPNDSGVPYLYGMDPIWQAAENKITFQNSYKMKSSIILGMAQMLFGLILAYRNHKFFNDRLALYCEWIPQMIFIWCIVGYLCFLIILKWTTIKDPNKAPSLLIGLINMFMFSPSPDGLYLFNGQNGFQHFLVILAVLMVPWMLLAKPYILYRRHAQRKQLILRVDLPRHDGDQLLHRTDSFGKLSDSSSNKSIRLRRKMNGGEYHSVSVNVDDTALDMLHQDDRSTASTDSNDSATVDKEEFNFGEVMIYQIIHTIEYCLNCISHTASYLRLWALSLAHSELSEVLWKMVMNIGLTAFPNTFMGGVMTFAIFWFFASLTVGILLLMEGLSAFLHALRLHWVEFQVKFYKGQGEQFQPFSFEQIFQNAEESN